MRSIRDVADEAESRRLRLTFLALVVVGLFVLLVARLWFLQIMAGEQFVAQATGNAVRTVTLDPPRGKIVDRDGETLVRNRFAPVVSVLPDEMGDEEDRREIYTDLAELLDMDVDVVAERAESLRYGPFRPRPIATDVPIDVISYIHEHSATRYPGVYAQTLPLRQYPHDSLASHLLGYIGEISAEELDSERYAGYRRGELIGWAGLERSREQWLRGTPGQRRLEVDPTGEVMRELGETPPVPGSDLRLTLDQESQKLVEDALAEGMEVARDDDLPATAGAAVVLNPDNGEIVAMASEPTFDPEQFVGGITQEDWDALNDPDNEFPLINRAVQSAQPPGSVFKVVTSLAALDEGVITPNTTLDCPGVWEWNTFRYPNWRTRDSGSINLEEALAESCNTYYFELARRMWKAEQAEGDEPRERIQSHAERLGLGEPTGVDLPGERGGIVPGRKWKRDYWERTRETTCAQAEEAEAAGSDNADLLAELCEEGWRWRGGDAVNLAIGQGDLLVSPLQMANVYAAIANRGTLWKPHVTDAAVSPQGEVTDFEPERLAELPYDRAHLNAVHRGLRAVNERGTAEAVFGDMPVPIAGKTGTAQNKPREDISWYVGYGPAEDPRYVVAVMVEEGGGGGETAAPITRHIFEGLFDLEQTPLTTGPDTD